MDCSPPGSFVHGIFQARLQGSAWPRDKTHISCISCIGRQILFLLFLFLFCIGEWPINNVVIFSGEQQRDSAMHIHVSILPQTGRFFTTVLPGKPSPLLLVNVKWRKMLYPRRNFIAGKTHAWSYLAFIVYNSWSKCKCGSHFPKEANRKER